MEEVCLEGKGGGRVDGRVDGGLMDGVMERVVERRIVRRGGDSEGAGMKCGARAWRGGRGDGDAGAGVHYRAISRGRVLGIDFFLLIFVALDMRKYKRI